MPWPASTGDHQYGALVRNKMKEWHGKGRELTASLVEVFTAFGAGSRGEVDGGGALEREGESAGEVESKRRVTKMTRWRYLRAWEVTTNLWVASASSSEAWARESCGGGGIRLRAEDGRGRRDGARIYRPDGER